jgi:hypothetical protein
MECPLLPERGTRCSKIGSNKNLISRHIQTDPLPLGAQVRRGVLFGGFHEKVGPATETRRLDYRAIEVVRKLPQGPLR